MSLADLNGAILKAAGYRIEQSRTKTVSGAWKYGLEFAGEGQVPFIAKASGKGSAARESSEVEGTSSKRMEIDLNDVNDVILALNEIEFSKFVILEDFHYLSSEAQQGFSFSLKAYHENSKLCFIIVGVWRDKNRLIYYNGDLTNRVISIDVDKWDREQLSEVVSAGEALLNIKFDDDVMLKVLSLSSESVALVQESCYRICELEGVNETQEYLRTIGSSISADDIVKSIVDDQAARYMAFITNFSEGFQQTDLEMYKWLTYCLLVSKIEDLTDGLRRAKISAVIKARHPEGAKLNEGNITQALQNAASLQVQKGVRPIIFDYDQTARVLSIVDKSFLIWLSHQNVQELLSEIGVTD